MSRRADGQEGTPVQGEDDSANRGNVPASFGLVWDAIADVIGTAATAALVRRAAKRVSAAHPGVAHLQIERKVFTPDYTLPPSWMSDPGGEVPIREFRALFEELTTLLQQLTGAVVVRRLAQMSLPLTPSA